MPVPVRARPGSAEFGTFFGQRPIDLTGCERLIKQHLSALSGRGRFHGRGIAGWTRRAVARADAMRSCLATSSATGALPAASRFPRPGMP